MAYDDGDLAEVGLSATQRDLFRRARTVARDELAPLDRHDGRVNRDQLRVLGSSGLLGSLFPTSSGEDFEPASALDICLIRESIAYESVGAESHFAMQGIAGYPLAASGPGHRDRWIDALRDGSAVAGFALTEPEVGSDAAHIQLEARRTANGWTLHGTKKWITNAPDAAFYVTFARTTPDAGAKGVSAFLVPADRVGLSGEPIDLISPHPLGTLQFDGVAVTADDLVGDQDRAFVTAMRNLDRFRPSVGAAALGMAQAALDCAVSYAKQRTAFGGPLVKIQAVSHQLAEAATEVTAARLLVRQAAAQIDSGSEQVKTTSAMAKMYATEVAQRAIDCAIQVHGAAGLEHGHLLERLYRDVRATRIYEGASEIQRDIIARGL